MRLHFVGQRTQKCDRENRELRWRQIKSIYRLYLDFVVNQPCYINSLNAWATNCATFRNQKLHCCTVFLLKTMKQRTLQVCSRANYTCLNRAEQSSLKEKVPPPWEHKLQLFFFCSCCFFCKFISFFLCLELIAVDQSFTAKFIFSNNTLYVNKLRDSFNWILIFLTSPFGNSFSRIIELWDVWFW